MLGIRYGPERPTRADASAPCLGSRLPILKVARQPRWRCMAIFTFFRPRAGFYAVWHTFLGSKLPILSVTISQIAFPTKLIGVHHAVDPAKTPTNLPNNTPNKTRAEHRSSECAARAPLHSSDQAAAISCRAMPGMRCARAKCSATKTFFRHKRTQHRVKGISGEKNVVEKSWSPWSPELPIAHVLTAINTATRGPGFDEWHTQLRRRVRSQPRKQRIRFSRGDAAAARLQVPCPPRSSSGRRGPSRSCL
jgi:hypothetical protein